MKSLRKTKSTPWSYKKGSSPLHRMSAGLKLSFLLILSLLSFLPGYATPVAAALLLVVLSFIARIGPLSLLRGSAPLFYLIVAVFLFSAVEVSPPGINLEGLKETIIFCFRIGIAFGAGALLFSVTTPYEIRKSLSRAESALRIQRLNLSLSVSLMLGFLKSFFENWEDLDLAWKSRGGKKNFSRMLVLVPLLVDRMMLQAAETAVAMEARGQGYEIEQ